MNRSQSPENAAVSASPPGFPTAALATGLDDTVSFEFSFDTCRDCRSGKSKHKNRRVSRKTRAQTAGLFAISPTDSAEEAKRGWPKTKTVRPRDSLGDADRDSVTLVDRPAYSGSMRPLGPGFTTLLGRWTFVSLLSVKPLDGFPPLPVLRPDFRLPSSMG